MPKRTVLQSITGRRNGEKHRKLFVCWLEAMGVVLKPTLCAYRFDARCAAVRTGTMYLEIRCLKLRGEFTLAVAYHLLHLIVLNLPSFKARIMIVSEMSNQECLKLLADARHARLACAADNQPYVVPMFLAYARRPTGEDHLYGFTTFGRKVEWMRANPRVCVEVDEVSNRSEWVSVVATGDYEELPNVHELTAGRAPSRSIPGEPHGFGRPTEQANEQLLAHRLLKARGMWWEPAATFRTSAADGQRLNRIVPVFFKIRLTQITGFRARHEQAAATPETLSASVDQSSSGWMRRAMTFWRRRGPVLDTSAYRWPNAR